MDNLIPLGVSILSACLKKAGPGETNLIKTENKMKKGEKIISPAKDPSISMNLFQKGIFKANKGLTMKLRLFFFFRRFWIGKK